MRLIRVMTNQITVLILVIGVASAWSQRQEKPKSHLVRTYKEEPSEEAVESKLRPRYAGPEGQSRSYILEEEEEYHPQGQQGSKEVEEYIDDEDYSAHKEDNQRESHQSSDKTNKEQANKEHSRKGGHQEFEQSGAYFDKHLKDHKADNKELENVKQHDNGEKFGSELVKEHKLGKNKEKSKGHKLHGFKNVYHKEEYGDHKTFHDEFLDNDHHHSYDDHNEHKEAHGDKFSKGYKHEGKNKKFDKGDETRQWGKGAYDGHHEGNYEKGGQSSKHRHGSKMSEGHHYADSQNNKHSLHKVKKGNPPAASSHVGHHGPHQAQIKPYIPHHHSRVHQQVHVPAQNFQPVHQENNKEDIHHNQGDHHYSHGGHHHNHRNHHDHVGHQAHEDHDSVHVGHEGHHRNEGDQYGHHREHFTQSHSADEDQITDSHESVPHNNERRNPYEQLEQHSEQQVSQKHEHASYEPTSRSYERPQYRKSVAQKEDIPLKHSEHDSSDRHSNSREDKNVGKHHKVKWHQVPHSHIHHRYHQEPRSHIHQNHNPINQHKYSHHHHHHHHPHHHGIHGGYKKHHHHLPSSFEQDTHKTPFSQRFPEHFTARDGRIGRHQRTFSRQH